MIDPNADPAIRWIVLEGDCSELLEELEDGSVDHVITDPPYSEEVHRRVRSSGRGDLPDVADFACRTRRTVDLKFEHLSAELRDTCAQQFARVAKRWTLVFSDVEGAGGWREDLIAAGLNYKRTGAWVRCGAPQFSGDRPASGFEAITMAHPKGRSRWNGGGSFAAYHHPIVANRCGQRGSRIHTTQKPLSLMIELVELFTNPGDLILDAFGGSGTTAIAALRTGRRAIVIERDPKWAELCRERLAAEDAGLDIQAARAGQLGLFAS